MSEVSDITTSLVNLADRVRQLEAAENEVNTAGKGWSGSVGGSAVSVRTITGRSVTALYAASEQVGGGSIGGLFNLALGASYSVYWDGVDRLEAALSAGGALTLQRTAGAETFDVSLWMVWA